MRNHKLKVTISYYHLVKLKTSRIWMDSKVNNYLTNYFYKELIGPEAKIRTINSLVLNLFRFFDSHPQTKKPAF